MIQRPKLQNRIASGLLGLALAGSSSLCLAGTPSAITNNFNVYSDTNGWNINFGTGTVGWDSTLGVDGTGCLKVTLSAANAANKEVAPLWDLGAKAFSTADYLTVEYDMMVDPTSGWDANFSYGNWQEVLRDSSWSWDSHWVGAVDTTYNAWKHMKFDIPNNAKTYPRLSFALQGTAPYTSDVFVYIDNLVITPFVNPLIVGAFTNQTEVDGWTAEQRATLSLSTKDAGTSTPAGSLKIDAAYDDTNTGWQEAMAINATPFNAARYTFATFDLYIENPNNLTDVGMMSLFTRGWTKIGEARFSVANNVGKWVHYEMALPATLTSADGLRFQLGGGMKAPLTYYLDNVTVYKPMTAPRLALKKAGSQGVQITMDDNSSQWQRDGISTPVDARGQNFFWTSQPQYPVSYSFTIADFPDIAKHPGFEAHLYIVNGDTGGTGNETSGSPDWGAPDVLQLRVQNGTAGGAVCSVEWKTNAANANPPAGVAYHPVVVNAPSALGTWTLSFSDATHGTVTGPGITATNFTLPEDAVLYNFSPVTSFLHFGMFKNDGANDGHNNQASGTFSSLKFTGNPYGYSINETFNGATLTNNYAWRATRASAVSYNPPGTAWWVNWTLPADGYSVQSAPTI
ncbi:MAG TPA: hypothetical protein VNT26_16150, partial [Candidatus Sulfotelmatobacter sp.]|nr:hypothetical protein [Candidatus Sulfotelmatobacter sp.]